MGKYGRHHIGKTFNEGKLTVVDGGNKVNSVKVKCAICSEDAELFGNDVFDIKYYNLLRGVVPCGCSGRYGWSLSQYKIKILRKISKEELPVEFLGFIENNKQFRLNLVKLRYKETGEINCTTTIKNFLRGDCNRSFKKTHDMQIEEFNKNNVDKIVWRTSKNSLVLGYYCKVCEDNNHESLFTVLAGELFNAKSVPCHCGAKTSAEYVIEVCNQMLHQEESKGITVIGAIRKGENKSLYPVYLCQTHGVYSRAFSSVKKIGGHCLGCSERRKGFDKQKHSHIYILEIQTPTEKLIGYGITNRITGRLSTHKRNLKSIGATITNIQVFEGSGTAVLAVENAIKSLHTTGLLDCEGFRRESISIDRKDEVLELCKKLKQLDNPDKLI